MPRFARRSRGVRRKRPTKWCGATSFAGVPIVSALVVADATPLCQPTTAVLDQADPLAGWVRGDISISHSGSTDTAPAVAWAIVNMRLAVDTNDPVQVFNPFAEADLERQDILGMGHCNIPAMSLTAADVQTNTREAMVTPINVKVGRRLARNTNNLFFWIVALGAQDNAMTAQVTLRTLMKFA